MERLALQRPKGATRAKKVLGRGAGSGHGCTAGRGTKGQNARSGGGVRPGFEGGQMPLFRQVARRGFSNYPFKTEFAVLAVGALNCFDDDEKVTKALLIEKGLVKRKNRPVKILGDGELKKRLIVEVDRLSASARRKIADAGGQIVEIMRAADSVAEKKKTRKRR